MKMMIKANNSTPVILLSILVFGAGILFFVFADTQPVVSDSIGYIIAGQEFAKGNGFTFTDSNNLTAGSFFYPHAFRMVENNSNQAAFGYPPGYPFLIAISIFMSGKIGAAYYVVPFFSVLGLLVVYGLGVVLTENKWIGLLASLLTVGTASYWQFGTSPWSEIPSLVFIGGGVFFYVLARKKNFTQPQQNGFALIAGVLGFGGIAGTAAQIAKILFVVFLVLFLISLLTGHVAVPAA